MSKQVLARRSKGSTATKRRAARPTTIAVPAWVFARDVVSEMSPALCRHVDQVCAEFRQYIPDDDDTAEARLVRALVEPGPDELGGDVLFAYRHLGLSNEGLQLLTRLRLRNRPGFCAVHDANQAVTAAEDEAGDLDGYQTGATLPPTKVYTLGGQIEVARGRDRSAAIPTTDTGMVRPFGCGDKTGDREVKKLASSLTEAVQATFGGAARLERDPVRVPICAAVATVWTFLEALPVQIKRETFYRLDVLQQAVRAVAPAGVRATLERVLVRNHKQHVPLYVADLDQGIAPPAWDGRLGLYVALENGLLRRAKAHEDVTPRVLRCLLEEAY